MKHIALAALFLASTTTAALAQPTHISATYKVSKDGHQFATITERFQRNGNRYVLESRTQGAGVYAVLARGSILLKSQGEVVKSGLRPEHFEYQRTDKPAKNTKADFDWKGGTLALQRHDQAETVKLPAGTQDRVSAMYQFHFMPKLPPRLDLNITDGKRLEQYRYVRKARTPLATPAGTFQTVHYVRKTEPGDNHAELWVAADKHRIPVKMIIKEEDGAVLEQVLTELRID